MNPIRRLIAWWGSLSAGTDSARMLTVLRSLPDFAFLPENSPTSRLELERSIGNTDYSALGELCYAAWLAEEGCIQLPEATWRVLAELADELGRREAVQQYWPPRLARPWEFSPPASGSFKEETASYVAMKADGKSALEVAKVLAVAGAGEVNGVRILRAVYDLPLADAVSAYRQARAEARTE